MPRIRQSDGASKGHPRTPHIDYGTKSEFSVGSPVLNEAQLIKYKYKDTATTAAPSILVPPTSRSVQQGSSTTFSVTVTGTGPFTYQWKKNGVNVGSNSPNYSYTPASTAESGATVKVVVTSAYGTVTSVDAVMTVTLSAAPVFSSQPITTRTIDLNAANVFNTNAASPYRISAYAPSATLQWRRNGQDIPGATSGNHYAVPYDALGIVQSGDVYTCAATNAGGTTVSNPCTLSLTPVPATTTIIETGLNFKKIVNVDTAGWILYALVDIAGQGALYKSTDFGTNWTRFGDTGIDYKDIVVGSINQNMLVTTSDNRVLHSTNGGTSFAQRVPASAYPVAIARDSGGLYEVGYVFRDGSDSAYHVYESSSYGAAWTDRGYFSVTSKFAAVTQLALCGDSVVVGGATGNLWHKYGTGTAGTWVNSNVPRGDTCLVGHSYATPAPIVSMSSTGLWVSNGAKTSVFRSFPYPVIAQNAVRDFNLSSINTAMYGRYPIRIDAFSLSSNPSNYIRIRRWTPGPLANEDITAVCSLYNGASSKYEYFYGHASGKFVRFVPTSPTSPDSP